MHLSDLEWAALDRVAGSVGYQAVAAMLHALSHDEQNASIAQFIQNELTDANERLVDLAEVTARQERLLSNQQHITALAAERPRANETLKFDVSKYKAAEGESLLRWFVELDDAIEARRIEDDSLRVMFAVSNLAGRARTWALGLKLRNRDCFRSYADFKEQLRQAFEPPKSEFRARTEFLDLKQGRRDIHAYAQHARYLVSCIVTDPVDDQTQVVTYIKGLVDGPIKTHLFREYPRTLEEAIRVSLQEDFSLRQAYIHSSSYRPTRREETGGPEPMDLSVATGAQGRQSNRRTLTCNRCRRTGHFAYECLAPHPASRGAQMRDRRDAGRPSNRSRQGGAQGARRDRPKNAMGQ